MSESILGNKGFLDSLFGDKNHINVLMCGGRRTGKTCIMASMRQDMDGMFSPKSVLMELEKEGDLSEYTTEHIALFSDDNFENMFYYADDHPSETSMNYDAQIRLNQRKSKISLRFTDVPGEWFIDQEHEDDMLKAIRDSAILIIAVDSPHLIEQPESYGELGKYHEIFNRAQIITDKIKLAFQNSNQPRLIVFAPVKCERYVYKALGESYDAQYLLDMVKKGYKDLIDHVENNFKESCAMVVTPCITMGGMYFMEFVPPRTDDGTLVTDEFGEPLKETFINPLTGHSVMNYLSKYGYLTNQDGDRYYEPKYCAQPLLYTLLFLIGYGKMRTGNGVFAVLQRLLMNLPNQADLDSCKQDILEKIKKSESPGFSVLNDPFDMFK